MKNNHRNSQNISQLGSKLMNSAQQSEWEISQPQVKKGLLSLDIDQLGIECNGWQQYKFDDDCFVLQGNSGSDLETWHWRCQLEDTSTKHLLTWHRWRWYVLVVTTHNLGVSSKSSFIICLPDVIPICETKVKNCKNLI